MSYLAFTACDEKYFYAHGPAYMQSCIETGTKFEIVVVDASSSKAEDMRSYVESERFGRVCVIERAENAPPMDRVGYACARFKYAAQRMRDSEETTSLLITDIDCLFIQPVQQPSRPIGLFTRESLPGTVGWEREGTTVAAGLVYVQDSPVGHRFINEVARQIETLPQQWFVDQVALNRAATSLRVEELGHLHKFTQLDMDWEFRSDSFIWTGKGDRKYNNLTYTRMKHDLERRFVFAS